MKTLRVGLRASITSILLLSITCSTYAAEVFNTNKEVTCSNRDVVFGAVIKEHGHTPMWAGVGSQESRFSYLMTENKKTGEWTIIQYDGEIGCIIAEGIKAKPIFTGKGGA